MGKGTSSGTAGNTLSLLVGSKAREKLGDKGGTGDLKQGLREQKISRVWFEEEDGR